MSQSFLAPGYVVSNLKRARVAGCRLVTRLRKKIAAANAPNNFVFIAKPPFNVLNGWKSPAVLCCKRQSVTKRLLLSSSSATRADPIQRGRWRRAGELRVRGLDQVVGLLSEYWRQISVTHLRVQCDKMSSSGMSFTVGRVTRDNELTGKFY